MKKRGWPYRVFRLLLRSVLWFLAAIALYLLTALVLMYLPSNSDYEPATEGVPLYLISNGVHLDLCIPRSALDADLAEQLLPYGSGSELVSFGWGDKGFFLHTPRWEDLKFSTAFKSLFVPTETAMHLTFYEEPPSWSKVSMVLLREVELEKLNAFLKEGFGTDASGSIQPINCCEYPGTGNVFFEGSGAYHLFQTCNTWSNAAVKSAGLKTAVWTPFDTGTLRYYP